VSKFLDYAACALAVVGAALIWLFQSEPEPQWEYSEDGWSRTDPSTGTRQEHDEWGWR
jgi:hypothetical protein